MDTFLARNKAMSHTPIPYLSELRAAGAPVAKTMIITCLDPRCIPEEFLDLNVGEAGVHRNAGGNVRHAIRDILILDELFKLEELIIIHHTDCGTLQYTNDSMTQSLKSRLDKEHWNAVDQIEFDANVDMEKSVKGDLEWVRENPMIREELKKGCKGFMFDIKTGEVKQVGSL